MKHTIQILLLCIAAAISYGVAHDLITAHLCVEYFSKTHPPLIASESPTLLALAWGVVATWWMGLAIGILLALVSRLGRWPTLDARDLLKPTIILLITMGTIALIAGFAGFQLSEDGIRPIPSDFAELVPPEKHHLWMAAWYAHNASYDLAALGGLVLAILALLTRRRRSRLLTTKA